MQFQIPLDFSIIIPTCNEEEFIFDVIDAIQCNLNSRFKYEIIVADNGSDDSTVSIAKQKNAKVVTKKNCTVAELRNFGASYASSDIFIFIDGDVLLTPLWADEIKPSLETLSKQPFTITGSKCKVPSETSWIEKCWFEPLAHAKTFNYINSGHLIITKNLFSLLNGFDSTLETGEDSDICERAKKQGSQIINNQKLCVIHLGYPKTIRHFFKRERWHGKGDYSSFSQFISSKPAVISIIQLSIILLCFVIAIIHYNFLYIVLCFLILLSLSAVAAYYKFRVLNLYIFPRIPLFFTYFTARSFSFFDVLFEIFYRKIKNR